MFGALFHGGAEDVARAFGAAPDSRLESSTARRRAPASPSRLNRPPLHSRAIVSEYSAIFFDAGRNHSHLMDAYGDIRGAKLLNPWFDPWNDRVAGVESLQELRSFLHVAARPFLLTLDWILHSDDAVAQLTRIGGAGVVHRIYHRPDVVRNLKLAAESTVLLAYSEKVARWVQEAAGAPCKVIRHPPLLFKNVPPQSVRQARDLKVSSRGGRPLVVAMTGEVRPGKGFEWVVRELAAQAKSAFVGNIVLCLAGGASVEDAAALRRQLDGSGLRFEFAVRPRTPLDHRGITDASFAKLLEKADIALFPYTRLEADSMSGHLVDSVFAGCRVIVSEESAMAPLVDRWSIGSVVATSKPSALLTALEREVAISSFPAGDDAKLDAFAAAYAIQAVNEEIVDIMRR
jgi:glycosyltransferase involved in cell wall biosynthesis